MLKHLELKLDEAILRETPRIDRGVNLIKMFAAIAPLNGSIRYSYRYDLNVPNNYVIRYW